MPVLEREKPVRIKKRERLTPGPNFTSLGIIGDGRTSRMFQQTIKPAFPDMPIVVIRRSTPDNDTFAILGSNSPEALIVATPEPTTGVLEEIAAHLDLTSDNLPTLILPQNGTKVATNARDILGNKINLIRASLLSPASFDQDGNAHYSDKLRIGLAAIPDTTGNVSETERQALEKAKRLYHKAGYDVLIFDNYEAMEQEKAFLNLVGMTGAIVGLDPKQTFADLDLYRLEMRAMHDRLAILKATGVDIADIPYGGAPLLPTLDNLPEVAQVLLRGIVADKIVNGRENKPSSVMEGIRDGRSTEAEFYLKTFIELGKKYGLRSVVDEAMLEVMMKHKQGEIDLAKLSTDKRKQILFKTIRQYTQTRNPLSEKVAEAFLENFHISIDGLKYLEAAREHLQKGGSILLLTDHFSIFDAVVMSKAIRKYLTSLDHVGAMISKRHLDPEEGLLNTAQAFLFSDWQELYGAKLISIIQKKDFERFKEKGIDPNRFNFAGVDDSVDFLELGGNVYVLYLEGTRSKIRKLLRAERGTELILHKAKRKKLDLLILPMAVEHGPIRPFNTKTKIHPGPLFSYDDLLADQAGYVAYYQELWKKMGVTDPKFTPTITVADCAMVRIGEHLPVEEQGVYTELTRLRRQFLAQDAATAKE